MILRGEIVDWMITAKHGLGDNFSYGYGDGYGGGIGYDAGSARIGSGYGDPDPRGDLADPIEMLANILREEHP